MAVHRAPKGKTSPPWLKKGSNIKVAEKENATEKKAEKGLEETKSMKKNKSASKKKNKYNPAAAKAAKSVSKATSSFYDEHDE